MKGKMKTITITEEQVENMTPDEKRAFVNQVLEQMWKDRGCITFTDEESLKKKRSVENFEKFLADHPEYNFTKKRKENK